MRGGCHFDVASSPLKWPGGALMWLRGTLKNRFRTLKKKGKKKNKKRKELIKPIECSDVLVQCQ